MKKLLGKKIKTVWFDRLSLDRLVFDTDDGQLAYQAYGDCCSRSWFSGITGVDALLGHTVRAVEEVLMSEVDDDPRHDRLKTYGIKITTDAGRADIEYRNSSNGYYGGDCEPIEVPDLAIFSPVTDDFSGLDQP